MSSPSPIVRLTKDGRNFVNRHPNVRRGLYPLIRAVRTVRGIANDYRMVRDFSEGSHPTNKVRAFRRALQTRLAPTYTVLFYPEKPSHEYVIRTVLARLGAAVTSDPHRDADAAFLWKDSTHVDRQAYIPALDRFPSVIEAACTNISKSHVGGAFARRSGTR